MEQPILTKSEFYRRWNEGIEKPFAIGQKDTHKNDTIDDDNIFSAITTILSKEEENSKILFRIKNI